MKERKTQRRKRGIEFVGALLFCLFAVAGAGLAKFLREGNEPADDTPNFSNELPSLTVIGQPVRPQIVPLFNWRGQAFSKLLE